MLHASEQRCRLLPLDEAGESVERVHESRLSVAVMRADLRQTIYGTREEEHARPSHRHDHVGRRDVAEAFVVVNAVSESRDEQTRSACLFLERAPIATPIPSLQTPLQRCADRLAAVQSALLMPGSIILLRTSSPKLPTSRSIIVL